MPKYIAKYKIPCALDTDYGRSYYDKSSEYKFSATSDVEARKKADKRLINLRNLERKLTVTLEELLRVKNIL